MSIKFNPLIFGGLDLTGGGPAGAPQWKLPVADESLLPMAGNTPGDARIVLDTDKIYIWDETTSKWIDTELTATAVGISPNADGLTLSTLDQTVGSVDITRRTINLEPADSTNPGVVSVDAQSFGGDKTFNDDVIVVGNIDAQGGVDSSGASLDIGANSTQINIYAQTDFQGAPVSNVGSLTTTPTTTDGVVASLYTNNGPDFAAIGFSSNNPGSAELLYSDGGVLSVNTSSSLTLDSPDINIGQVSGTTDIVGTVTIEYNPADPTDWAPAPDDVIEAIDQLAERFVERDLVTKEPTGFPNRDDSVLSFTDSLPDRTFSITPTGASFDFYVKGKKFTKTTTQSIQIPDLAGDHYIYFNDLGVLATIQVASSDLYQNNALVSIVYWNTDTSTHTYFAEERHGLVMDGATHTYLHTVFGARYLSGLALQNFTIGTGNSDADAQFDADQGTIRDEDILIQISAAPQIPILYREGQQWRKKAADAFPMIYSGTAGYVGANGRLPYNQYTGGAWQLTEVNNNKYVLVHFFGTNDIENGIVGIQGIAEYDSMEAARTAANSEISSLSGLPFAEFVAIGTVLFQTANTFGNTPKADVIPVDGANYVDFRGTQLYTPAGNATTHSLLSGLAADDHFQYLLADGTRAMSGALDMGTHQINNVVDGVASDDAATVGQLTNATTGTPNFFAGFDNTGVLSEVPGWVFYDDGSLEIGAQNSITIPPTIDDYISISISPTVDVTSTDLNNLTGVQLNSPINDNISSYNGFQAFGYGTAAPDNFTGYLSQPGYSGTGTSITHFSASGSADCSGNLVGLGVTSSSDADTITGVNVATTGDATTLTGIQVTPSGTHTDAVGLKIDLSSTTTTNRPVAIDASGGSFNTTETFQANSALVVDSGNVIRPIFEIPSGSPLVGTTDVIMNNLAGYMDFKDDFTSGPIGIGVSSVGFVSQVAADVGVDVDKIAMLTTGLAIDGLSAGGTITDAHLIRGFGANFGGSLTIDNIYGLKIENSISSLATNAWGISVEDSNAENYLAKSLKIGGSAATTNNEIAIEIGSDKSIRVGLATTAQRTTLTNLSGLVIYDTDLNKFFGNDGSQWIQLNLSIGDIDQTSFPASDNVSPAQDITSFVFSNAVTRGFEAVVTIERGSTYAEYSLKGIQKGSSWEMSQDYIGDDTGIVFNITTAGQIQYTSTNTGSGATIKFRAKTV